MITNSLTFRLIVTSTLWVVITLVIVAVLLTVLFQERVEEYFDAFMFDHLEENVAAGRLSDDGQFYMSWVPSDQRFNEPLSGWYWQVNDGKTVIATSSSLTDRFLQFKLPDNTGELTILKIIGPNNEKLRVLVVDALVPGSSEVFTFSIAGSVSGLQYNITDYTTSLGLTLIALGVGLVFVIIIQIRVGLKPLRELQTALQSVRSGEAKRLPTEFPVEVQPTITELNSMMDHSEALLDRARTQVGDLAHALKNPLTVIRNEANDLGDKGDVLHEKADLMGNTIERYLARARAAGSGNIIGASIDVEAIVTDLCYLVEQTYRDRQLVFDIDGLEGFRFRGDAQDLEEMLGNLIDNAGKWARSMVRIKGERDGAALILTVEDDGPGVPVAERGTVLQRGKRLDERVPGTGLGLGIVTDLAQLYRGVLELGESASGGLKAVLRIPAAE